MEEGPNSSSGLTNKLVGHASLIVGHWRNEFDPLSLHILGMLIDAPASFSEDKIGTATFLAVDAHGLLTRPKQCLHMF